MTPIAPPSSTTLFERVRSSASSLSDETSVSIDNLLCLVAGTRDRFLNGDAIRDLLQLAVRSAGAAVGVLEPLNDTNAKRGREILASNVRHKRDECAKTGATRLLVPWNNMSGHWTLMCLDVAAQTASYTDSLPTSHTLRPPPELRAVCKLFFGEQWAGSIDVVPSPQQPDSHNCGVYVLLNAWHLVRALPLPAEYPPADQIRVWLARCWVHNRALDFKNFEL